MNHKRCFSGFLVRIVKTVCALLCAVMVLNIQPIFAQSCKITGTYNAEEAILFAKDITKHLENDYGKCAWYVTKCLNAGGISFKTNKGTAFDTAYVPTLVQALTDKNSGIATKTLCTSKSMKNLVAGDIILFGEGTHVMFVTAVGKDCCYISQNNTFRHEAKKTFNEIINASGFSDDHSYIIHIKDSAKCSHLYNEAGVCTLCNYTYNCTNNRIPQSGTLFANGGKIALYSSPYAITENSMSCNGKQLVCDTQISYTAYLVNAFNELWFEVPLSSGQIAYAFCNSKTPNDDKIPYYAKGIAISGIAHPASFYAADKKTSFSAAGKIACSTILTKISVGVYQTSNVNGAITETLCKSGKQYLYFENANVNISSISNLGSLKSTESAYCGKNKTLKSIMDVYFNKLPSGSYVYRIIIEAATQYGDNTLDEDRCTMVLEYPFIVNDTVGDLKSGKPANTYITYYANDGTGDKTTETIKTGSSVILPTLEKEGYTFLGWSDNPNGKAAYQPGAKFTPVYIHANSKGVKKPVLADSLYGVWQMNPITNVDGLTDESLADVTASPLSYGIDITIDPNQPGILEMENYHIAYDSTITLHSPQSEKTPGAEFVGWSIKNNNTGKWYIPLFKSWSGDFLYKLLFSASYLKGEMCAITFNDDFIDDDTIDKESTNLSYTITANWKAADTNIITYLPNCKDAQDVPDSQIIKKGEPAVIAFAPTREGYSFTGWNTKADGSGITYKSSETLKKLSEDITLYAQWTKTPIQASEVIKACTIINTNITIKALADCPVFNVPGISTTYPISEKTGVIKEGECVNAIEIVQNVVGHYWYKIRMNDGTYGYTYYENTEIQSVAATVSIDKQWDPQSVADTLVKNITGVISLSAKDCCISAVYADITTDMGEDCEACDILSIESAISRYTLKGSNLEKQIRFDLLQGAAGSFDLYADISAYGIVNGEVIVYTDTVAVQPSKTFAGKLDCVFTFEGTKDGQTQLSGSYGETIKVSATVEKRSGYTFVGWMLTRDGKILCENKTFNSTEAINRNKLTKKVFKNGEKLTIDDTITDSQNHTFIFEPVWQSNNKGKLEGNGALAIMACELTDEGLLIEVGNTVEMDITKTTVLAEIMNSKGEYVFSKETDFENYGNENKFCMMLECGTLPDENYTIKIATIEKNSEKYSGTAQFEIQNGTLNNSVDIASIRMETVKECKYFDSGIRYKVDESGIIDGTDSGIERGFAIRISKEDKELINHDVYLQTPNGKLVSLSVQFWEGDLIWPSIDDSVDLSTGEYSLVVLIYYYKNYEFDRVAYQYEFDLNPQQNRTPFFEVSYQVYNNLSTILFVDENGDVSTSTETNYSYACIEKNGVVGHIILKDETMLGKGSYVDFMLIDAEGNAVGREYWWYWYSESTRSFCVNFDKQLKSGNYHLVAIVSDYLGIVSKQTIPVTIQS